MEFYDEEHNEFFSSKPITVKLEHSLISISKWEGIWQKSYFPSSYNPGLQGVTEELSYISCMIIGKVPDYVPGVLIRTYKNELHDYINSPKTATKVHHMSSRHGVTPTITSELVYYWMIKYGIPFECQQWHFSRLLALIEVCNLKENPKDHRMNAVDSAKYRYELNKARRAAYDKDIPT
jgi:hypothetical protein